MVMRIVIFLMGLCVFPGIFFGQEVTEPMQCPSSEELGRQLEIRSNGLLAVKGNLLKLQQGQIISVSPATLFTVDLNSPEAIRTRAQNLAAEVETKAHRDVTSHPLYQCAGESAALMTILQTILQLEQEINQLRLEFLSLPEDRRRTLLAVQEQASLHRDNLMELAEEKAEAKKTAVAADLAAQEAESLAQVAVSHDLREVQGEKAILETYRKGIAELSIVWTSELQVIAQMSQDKAETLSQDASVLSHPASSLNDLRGSYADVVQHWRDLTDEVLGQFTAPTKVRTVPELPKIREELLQRLHDHMEAQEYREVYGSARREQEKLIVLQDRLERESAGANYRLLLVAGRLRAQLIRELANREDRTPFALNNDYFRDLFREIRLIPYRPLVIVKSQLNEGRELISSGISGILTLAHRLLLLVTFLVAPFIAYAVLMRGSARLDQLRVWLIRSRHKYERGPFWALWIKRLNPYFPWLIMFTATGLAAAIVEETELESLTEILPYFRYFFLYRIFRLMVESSVIAVTAYLPKSREESVRISKRMTQTARFLGLFLLSAAYLLNATQVVARTGLFYNLVLEIVLWFTPALFAVASYWWREDLGHAARDLLPEILGKKLQQWCHSGIFLGLLASFPTLAIVLTAMGAKWLARELSEVESVKKISAQFFRHKIETAAKKQAGDGRPPPTLSSEYLAYFELGVPVDHDLLIAPECLPLGKVRESIEAWKSDARAEHTLAIQGFKGAGKSSFLKLLETTFNGAEVLSFSIPDKITDRTGILNHLSQVLGTDLSGGEEALVAWDGAIGKKILLIDDGQNLFLSRRGGFEAFRTFISLLSAGTRNIFWCVTFNSYSWSYLNAVTGGAEYFSQVLSIGRWTDDDIRALILKRHQKSNFKLEFDPIIYAAEGKRTTESLKYVHERFFELLWEQSKGNPRAAVVLWISSLKTISEHSILVGLPAPSPVRPLAGLTDDELFVIASIVRHENLTVEEARSTTSLGESTVRHALRIGIERGFLDRSSDNRYRIRPTWQAVLTQQLVSKNFVYET